MPSSEMISVAKLFLGFSNCSNVGRDPENRILEFIFIFNARSGFPDPGGRDPENRILELIFIFSARSGFLDPGAPSDI